MFNWKKIKKPIIGLAPMADYTDSPFSLMCKKFGADIIYREMVSADAIVFGNEKTLGMAKFEKGERPIILQIFGKDPDIMAQAAKILQKKYKPDGIDINMGCPVRKIVSNFNGASLIKNPKLAREIVGAVKSAVRIPVSVKTRLGWSKPEEILKFAPALERAGADALAIHGRTKMQGYKGSANWEIIGKVVKKVKIPVLANGDVVDKESFKKVLKITGAQGVLIGRATLGNPCIFKELKTIGFPKPNSKELRNVVLQHARLHLKHYGKEGIITFRKHLTSYVKGMPGAKRLREHLVHAKSIKEIEEILKF